MCLVSSVTMSLQLVHHQCALDMCSLLTTGVLFLCIVHDYRIFNV